MSNEPFSDPARLVQQLMTAAESMSDEEAGQRYRQILGQLPRDEAAQLNTLALTQVAPNERRVLASGLKQAHQNPDSAFDGYDDDDDDVAATPQSLGRMTARAAQQDPGLVNNLLGGENSALGGQIGKAALAALAAMLIRQYMSGQGQQAGGGYGAGGAMGQGADPIGAILGGLLGGGGGMGGRGMPGGGGDLGSILGQVLGGGGQAMPGGRTGGQMGGGGPDLGSILGQVLGGGGQAMPGGRTGGQMGGGAPDLGSILGSILGGAGSSRSHRKD